MRGEIKEQALLFALSCSPCVCVFTGAPPFAAMGGLPGSLLVCPQSPKKATGCADSGMLMSLLLSVVRFAGPSISCCSTLASFFPLLLPAATGRSSPPFSPGKLLERSFRQTGKPIGWRVLRGKQADTFTVGTLNSKPMLSTLFSALASAFNSRLWPGLIKRSAKQRVLKKQRSTTVKQKSFGQKVAVQGEVRSGRIGAGRVQAESNRQGPNQEINQTEYGIEESVTRQGQDFRSQDRQKQAGVTTGSRITEAISAQKHQELARRLPITGSENLYNDPLNIFKLHAIAHWGQHASAHAPTNTEETCRACPSYRRIQRRQDGEEGIPATPLDHQGGRLLHYPPRVGATGPPGLSGNLRWNCFLRQSALTSQTGTQEFS
ncbi:uncharacterized protein LOC121394222 [Xenopus laevis]|uniref:Uncharacterized protein LOC121394222 n=1 Tax=Xenopus laevis TaxID=8355 RepID=A0A8J1KT76_XENLA|nr:uncharacterized protein LOC121394222 [Xenopus laevis]